MENDKSLEAALEGDDELYEHFQFTADPGQAPLRVDKYLMN
ncbi:MAG: RNA pseudouridine synthase, partial [Flavobacteriaceae bacterium]